MDHIVFESPDLAQSFIRKLLYFDIFSHPLTARELFEYCDVSGIDHRDGRKILNQLLAKKLVNLKYGYYFLGDDSSKVLRRREGNMLADLRMKDARKYSAIVAAFPFVRGVFISGSLSKHVMKQDSDIDFFIITEPGKLWICRALLTLYKKVVLKNSHRNFCLNYFIDSNNLEIPDKNIFTATEVAFLLPMYNYPLYLQFMEKNAWIRSEFPNLKIRSDGQEMKPGISKIILEKLFNNPLGYYLDNFSYSVIVGFWKKKFRNLDEKSFALNFRSHKNVSKHHPNAFQEKVVKMYLGKIETFETTYGFPLFNGAAIKSAK